MRLMPTNSPRMTKHAVSALRHGVPLSCRPQTFSRQEASWLRADVSPEVDGSGKGKVNGEGRGALHLVGFRATKGCHATWGPWGSSCPEMPAPLADTTQGEVEWQWSVCGASARTEPCPQHRIANTMHRPKKPTE